MPKCERMFSLLSCVLTPPQDLLLSVPNIPQKKPCIGSLQLSIMRSKVTHWKCLAVKPAGGEKASEDMEVKGVRKKNWSLVVVVMFIDYVACL